MATLQVSFLSKAMRREVTFNALLPLERFEEPANPSEERKPFKSLYLLHGYMGSHSDWINYTRIRELAFKHQIAVFMPAGENHFYVDNTGKKELHGQYVGEELVSFTREMFPLSERREDTWIGGLSMGGYGAIRAGYKYADTFGNIIALSPALITYQIANASPDYKDEVADYDYFCSVFGDLTQLQGSDQDPEALIHRLKAAGKELPELYMACGTEDFLLDVNQKFHRFLMSERIQHTYIETKGDHNWDFWNDYIEKALDHINEQNKGSGATDGT